MKTIVIGIMSCVCLTLVFSCTSFVTYRNGSRGSLKSYTSIPEYQGENSTASYVSGNFSTGKNNEESNEEDRISIFAINAHRSHSFKLFNFYYGAGARYGNYTFRTGFLDIVEAGDKKSFYNLDAKVGGNFQRSWKWFDWRILGAELTYTYETGSYQDRLDELDRDLDIIVDYSQPSTVTFNLNTELVWKVNNKHAVGLGFFYGSILNPIDEDSTNSDYSGIMGSYRYTNYTFSIIQSGLWIEPASSIQFGLTYRFF